MRKQGSRVKGQGSGVSWQKVGWALPTKKERYAYRWALPTLQLCSLSLLLLFFFLCVDCFAGEISFSPAVNISHPDKRVSSPSIASDSKGRIYIAWVREDADGANIYIAGSSDSGKTFDKGVKVNPKGMGANGTHANPEIAVGLNNELYVLWSSPRKEDGSDILFARSFDNGKTFEKPMIVNDDNAPVSRGFESMTVGKDGIIHIVWFDGRDKRKDGTTATYYARSLDSGKTFERNIRLDENTCVCCRSAITVDALGNVYASWRKVFDGNIRDMVAAASKDNGKTFSEPVVVNHDNWSIAGCPHRGDSLGIDKNGYLYITWYTEGGEAVPSVYFAVSKDNGKTFSERTPIPKTRAVFPDHPKLSVTQDGKVFFVWEEITPVFSRILFRYLDGEKLSEPVQISDGVRKSHDPAIAIDKDGNIIIAWSYEEIRFTRTVLKIGARVK